MNLRFDLSVADSYVSKQQKVRVLTEKWIGDNGYCPRCGYLLSTYANNNPGADFFCNSCEEDFELKSKFGNLTAKIPDGAYATMIHKINELRIPNLFLLAYSKDYEVRNLCVVPKHFLTVDIIDKKKPLSATARRAGWTGCNINLSAVPEAGKVYLIKNSKIVNRDGVQNRFKRTLFLRKKKPESKGWIVDILRCIEQIPANEFSLSELYEFERQLKSRYPKNNFIKDKMRQQLQILRDEGLLEFKGKGQYKKVMEID